MKLDELLARGQAAPGAFSRDEMAFLLELEDAADLQRLFAAAYAVKLRRIGKVVSLRGIIEMGNRCAKDCLYCGIRRGNANVERFELDEEAVVRMAKWAFDQQYGSIVIQSGEIESAAHTALITRILRRVTELSDGELGVTLSLGEQTEAVYRAWREAGAHRYLLRIESSSPEFYRRLHPADHDFDRRLDCLRLLRKLDYQVGSGVMIGLPGQTAAQLAADLDFFRRMDLDMIGMGPYIPHPDTPLGVDIEATPAFRARQLKLGLKMIAVARLLLHDVNIAATTALQALADDGREQGILAGANVIMPNVTDTEYRGKYQLYAGKPCLDENSSQCRSCLSFRIAAIGETINWARRGDPHHYAARKNGGGTSGDAINR